MKNKITCLLAGAALFGATANAEIALTDELSAYGYIDIVSVDGEIGNDDDRKTSTSEFELGLSFTPAESAFSAVAEISFNGDDSTDLETVTVTYQASDSLSITAGRILSYQGLESYDAPNNYFVSYAGYDNNPLYSAGYADGVSVDYSAGDISLGVWGGDQPAGDDIDFEYYIGYTGIENLSLAVAIADNDDGSETTNLMATYEFGDFTVMAENVDSEGFSGDDVDVTSVTVAYSMGDITLAARLADGEYGADDYENTSLSVFKALSDNAAIGFEYSEQERASTETDGVAVELLYVF